MKPEFFCCIGGELKDQKQGLLKSSRIFMYRAAQGQTIADMLADGFFNDADDLRVNDLILLYCPEETRSNAFAKVSSISGGVVKTTKLTVDPKDLEDIYTQLDKKVNIDGSSIMTGPLKMRAGSMQCAIAAYWDGVGFFKLNSNDSVTLLASMEATDGLCPATNNTYNIGKTNYKWKDAHIARVITAVINNGYDIAVPVTNSADTLALKSQVDDAANSGEQLYTTGVWYAKMYAATTVPTGSEYEGRNYADFSQVDGNNDPIIVVYTYTSGAWTLTETITPPANHNGYMTITSKIWDIQEQAGQQGGLILWAHNQGTFTPYPRIVSFNSIDVTGESTVDMPLNPVPQQIVNKNYVDNVLAKTQTKSPDGNILGTVTVSQTGDISGMNPIVATNSFALPAPINFADKDFELGMSFTTGSSIVTARLFGHAGSNPSDALQIWTNSSGNFNYGTTGTHTLQPNTKYYIKLIKDSTSEALYISTDGINYEQDATKTNRTFAEYTYNICGLDSNGETIVHLSDCYININGIRIWQGMDAPGLQQRVAKGHEVIDFQAPTAGNNYTWYRKYTDGWVEQGGTCGSGTQTTNLLVAMADTNYSVTLTSVFATGTSDIRGRYLMSKTTTSFDSSSVSAGTGIWEVKGMAA